MWHVYAISSLSRTYIYVGISMDVDRRINEHNRGYEKTTRPYRPFKLIYTQSFSTRGEARAREKYLKGGSGKKLLKSLK